MATDALTGKIALNEVGEQLKADASGRKGGRIDMPLSLTARYCCHFAQYPNDGNIAEGATGETLLTVYTTARF